MKIFEISKIASFQPASWYKSIEKQAWWLAFVFCQSTKTEHNRRKLTAEATVLYGNKRAIWMKLYEFECFVELMHLICSRKAGKEK